MRAFTCPNCRNYIEFEDLTCRTCEAELGFHHPSSTFHVVSREGTEIDGERWFACSNRAWACNWLAAEDSGAGTCLASRLIRKRPDADDTLALEKLATTSGKLRMMVYQLLELGLPILPWDTYEKGLGFDLLSSKSRGENITIGHADGIITIDLVESLDDYRERLRIRLGEPYRTMLGHFRHEVGHYYEMVLFDAMPDRIDRVRELFGDERVSYSDAIDRHYRYGAPENWRESFISEYATMHPWEDFAECFAHYLHITDTLDTAAWSGMVLQARTQGHTPTIDTTIARVTEEIDFDEILEDWLWVSTLLNRINRSMGKDDLYPFHINAVVGDKLGFIHDTVRSADAMLHAATGD